MSTDIEHVTLATIYSYCEDPGYYFDNVSSHWFSVPSCQVFYETCHKLYKQGKSFNSTADLMAELDKANGETKWGAFIADLLDTPTSFDDPGTVSRLKGEYLRRKMMLACSRGVDHLRAEKDPYTAVSDITRYITEIDTDNMESFMSASELTVQSYERIKARNENEQEHGYRTGFKCFDSILNIRNGLLIIIAGRPRMGKTALSLTMARQMCNDGISVGFFSCEMPKEEIDDRFTQMDTGISTQDMNRFQGLDKGQMRDVKMSCEDRCNWSFYIDDAINTIDAIERKARRMKRMGVQVIFIDQLSKITGGKGTDYEKFTERCNRIADLKKELGIPIFLLAQINRGSDLSASKEPTIAHLKQTGALEEDADMIFLVHRPEEFENDPVKKKAMEGCAIVNLAKHRQGKTWRECGLHFLAERCMYANYGYVKEGEYE